MTSRQENGRDMMINGWYTLDDANNVVPLPSYEDVLLGDRQIVGLDTVGKHTISTVFLGLDHRFSGDGPPIVFETMVFPGEQSIRYETWSQAEAGHARVVASYRREHRWLVAYRIVAILMFLFGLVSFVGGMFEGLPTPMLGGALMVLCACLMGMRTESQGDEEEA